MKATILRFLAVWGLSQLTSNHMQAQLFTNTTPVSGALNLKHVADGLGMEQTAGITFYKAVHTFSVAEMSQNLMPYSVSIYANPAVLNYSGSNYNLTVTLGIQGGIINVNGVANLSDPNHVYMQYFSSPLPLEGSYTWIVGGETYIDTFSTSLLPGFSQDYAGSVLDFDPFSHLNLQLNVIRDASSFFHIGRNILLTEATTPSGDHLKLELIPEPFQSWHLGYSFFNFDFGLSSPLALYAAPEPNSGLLALLGTIPVLFALSRRRRYASGQTR